MKAVTTVSLLVANQNEALAFYTEKLGFEIRTDITNGDFRWLTVGLPGQPDLEFVLLEVKPDWKLSQEDADTIKALLRAGKIDTRPVISTDDIQKDYEELTARGVEFISPPTSRGWGSTDALFKDHDGGSWLLLQQDR